MAALGQTNISTTLVGNTLGISTHDVECDYTHLNGEVLVTGQVTEEGGNYAS